MDLDSPDTTFSIRRVAAGGIEAAGHGVSSALTVGTRPACSRLHIAATESPTAWLRLDG
jgi:hypothetical protein